MNLIIYKHYDKDDNVSDDINSNAANGDHTIGYVSGNEDIMDVLKALIKTKYTVS